MRNTTLLRRFTLSLSIGCALTMGLSPNRVAADQKLTASARELDDHFGFSVAIGDRAALIGTPFDDNERGFDAGAAYLFPRTATGFGAPQTLLPTPGGEQYYFGLSVALDGDTAVVGSYGDGDQGVFAGAAYVYVRSGTTWSLQQKLVAADPAASQFFGWSVAIDGDTLAVGAVGDASHGPDSGAVYVFVRHGSVWSHEQKLSPSSLIANAKGGVSVAVRGDVLVLGAIGDVDNDVGAGAAYTFTRATGHWTQRQKLVAATGSTNDNFGYSVALAPGFAIIGAAYDDQHGSDAGAVHVFSQSGNVWTLQQKLLGTQAEDLFGYSLAVSGQQLLVGAAGVGDQGPSAGAAYLYEFVGPTYARSRLLLAPDGSENALFGSSVALHANTALVGAEGDAETAGAAYVVDVNVTPTPALELVGAALLSLALVLLAMRRASAPRASV